MWKIFSNIITFVKADMACPLNLGIYSPKSHANGAKRIAVMTFRDQAFGKLSDRIDHHGGSPMFDPGGFTGPNSYS